MDIGAHLSADLKRERYRNLQKSFSCNSLQGSIVLIEAMRFKRNHDGLEDVQQSPTQDRKLVRIQGRQRLSRMLADERWVHDQFVARWSSHCFAQRILCGKNRGPIGRSSGAYLKFQSKPKRRITTKGDSKRREKTLGNESYGFKENESGKVRVIVLLWYQTYLIDVSVEQTRILTSEALRRSDSEEFWNAVPHIDDADLIAALEEVERKHVKKETGIARTALSPVLVCMVTLLRSC